MFKSILATIVLLASTAFTTAQADAVYQSGTISFKGEIVIAVGLDQETLEPVSPEAVILNTETVPIYENGIKVGEQVTVSWN